MPKMTVIYECKKCGTEVTVNSSGVTSIDPIYCCGLPLYRKRKMIGNAEKKKVTKAPPKKESVRKSTKKTSKKGAS